MLRKFFIWLTRSLLVILAASLVFSFISFNIPDMVNNLFSDVFAYASPEAQKETISKLTLTCASLSKGGKVISVGQICQNASLLAAIKENCNNYKALKARGAKVENEDQIRQTCEGVDSGDLEKQCSSKTSVLPDLEVLSKLCQDYGSGSINDRQFFAGVLASPFGGQQVSLPQVGFLEKYHKSMDFLDENKIWYFAAIGFLLIVLYLLIWNLEMYLTVLASMCFSIGLLIMIPYAAIMLYDTFIGIDTTALLESIFGGKGIQPSSIASVIMLLFLRTYNVFIVILGIILLGIGMAGKGYHILAIKDKKK